MRKEPMFAIPIDNDFPYEVNVFDSIDCVLKRGCKKDDLCCRTFRRRVSCSNADGMAKQLARAKPTFPMPIKVKATISTNKSSINCVSKLKIDFRSKHHIILLIECKNSEVPEPHKSKTRGLLPKSRPFFSIFVFRQVV